MACSSAAGASGGWRTPYLNTLTHKELTALLNRGGVIGGSSAGASILTSFMVRGDTKSNEQMIGDHTVGLGFLKNAAVDQHLLRRNRQFDMLEVIDKHPELLGIGLDEDTAIVVEGDQFDVIGRSYAVIYSNKPVAGSSGRFYFMGAGDRFDMKTRKATRQGNEWRPSPGREAPVLKGTCHIFTQYVTRPAYELSKNVAGSFSNDVGFARHRLAGEAIQLERRQIELRIASRDHIGEDAARCG